MEATFNEEVIDANSNPVSYDRDTSTFTVYTEDDGYLNEQERATHKIQVSAYFVDYPDTRQT